MDPLHPLVPIQPPPPTPPAYNRVERIERDGQQDSGPDWERGSEEESEDRQEQFEDDYDPNWSDPAAVEPYGPDGATHDAATSVDLPPSPPKVWDPRVDPDRRAHPRDELDDPRDDSDPDPEQHIDISA